MSKTYCLNNFFQLLLIQILLISFLLLLSYPSSNASAMWQCDYGEESNDEGQCVSPCDDGEELNDEDSVCHHVTTVKSRIYGG